MNGARVQRGQIVKAVLVTIVLELIGNAAGIVIGLVTSRSASPTVLALTVTAVSVVTGLAIALLPKNAAPAPPPPPVQYPWGDYRPQSAPRRASSMPALTVVLVILAVLGIGGVATSYGLQQGFDYVRGLVDPASEPGVQRLAAETSSSAGPLTLTVHSVTVTSRVTMVELSATNSGNDSLSLPVYGYCQLAVDGSATLEADPNDSDWAQTAPPGGTIRGVISFDGPLEKSVTEVDLSFLTVFGSVDPDSPDSITVADIMLVSNL